jgi:hypothetical protein
MNPINREGRSHHPASTKFAPKHNNLFPPAPTQKTGFHAALAEINKRHDFTKNIQTPGAISQILSAGGPKYPNSNTSENQIASPLSLTFSSSAHGTDRTIAKKQQFAALM